MVNYLTTLSSGNPHDNGTIDVTSNNILDGNHPKNLLNLNSKLNFLEGDINDNSLYIRFDFKKMSIEISQYAIKSCGKGHAILKNWVFEISEDGQKWTEIDRRNEYEFVSEENVFDVEKKKFARFCQLRQIGPHSDDFHRLWINAVEFYGKLNKFIFFFFFFTPHNNICYTKVILSLIAFDF